MKGSKAIFYTICRYIPDILRGESINVGIVTHMPEVKKVSFHKTKNLSRVRNFDDEIGLDVLKALLESVNYQFNTKYLLENEKNLENEDLLKQETSYFINQIQFGDIQVLKSENVSEDIEDLKDMYLYYDKKKSDRIDPQRVRTLASKIVKQSEWRKNVDRNPRKTNTFDQEMFDLSIDMNGNTTYVKAITFDYKDKNKFYNEVKGLLYDLDYFLNNEETNIKVVINNTNLEEEYEKLAYNLLKDKVDIYTLEEFDNYLRSLSPFNYKQLELFDNKASS